MTIEVSRLEISDVLVLKPKRHADSRGFFSETYNTRLFSQAGIEDTFIQDNHASSARKYTLRGLHFQTPPFAQAKLVRVVRGAIFDVAVDIRVGSSTFGQHVSTVISAEEWNQIYIPIGFAHGLLTLEPDTDVLYKVSNFYSPAHDKGLLWNDPALGIDWPVTEDQVATSAKDANQPRLSELPAYFHQVPPERQ